MELNIKNLLGIYVHKEAVCTHFRFPSPTLLGAGTKGQSQPTISQAPPADIYFIINPPSPEVGDPVFRFYNRTNILSNSCLINLSKKKAIIGEKSNINPGPPNGDLSINIRTGASTGSVNAYTNAPILPLLSKGIHESNTLINNNTKRM